MALTKQPDAAHILAAGAVTVAEIVTPEVQVAAVRAISLEGPTKVDETLSNKRDEVFRILKTLFTAAGMNVSFDVRKIDDTPKVDAARAKSTDATSKLSQEVLEACRKGLEKDFNRGIVVVDDKKTIDQYTAELSADKSAGTTWGAVRAKLEANECALLRKAARIQGGGELIGVDTTGNLVIISRADEQGNREPEIFGFTEDQIETIGNLRKPKGGEKPHLINTDTPNREALMDAIKKSGLFADYWEIRSAVTENGYTLPPDSPDYTKEGIVAAVEAVTGKDFVRSKNGKEWRSAILECGDMSRSAFVRVVNFVPNFGHAYVNYGNPKFRDGRRGAVRVLRG